MLVVSNSQLPGLNAPEYAAHTHGFISKWNYLLRTIPDISDLLQPLEDAIRLRFLPALTGKTGFCNWERDLLELPARLGGHQPDEDRFE